MKVAVIGSGVSGLAAAYRLAKAGVHVTVYEKDATIGGHACTLQLADKLPVDVGFMVFNRVTYPNLVAFFEDLGVEMEESNMSFSVSLDQGRGCEWGSNGLAGLFAYKRNALNPFFWRMIREMLLFEADARRYVEKMESRPSEVDLGETLGAFLERHGYSAKFRDAYLVPICASIWSCGAQGVLAFAASSVLLFLRNHHMLQLLSRPQWLTVKGRSQQYTAKVLEALKAAGAEVRTSCAVTSVSTTSAGGVQVEDARGGREEFDRCVVAAHAPDALSLLGDGASAEQRRILGAFEYSESHVYLHRDSVYMPKRRAAWASWNFQGCPRGRVCVTYWLNLLQNLGDTGAPVFVTLNPDAPPRDIERQWSTGHPIPSPAAAAAARQLGAIQGHGALWFCGAYQGFGFHEDGFKAGLEAADGVLGARTQLLPYEKHMVCTWPQLVARTATLKFLRTFVHLGHLRLHEAGGTVLEFGGRPGYGRAKGETALPPCLLRIHRPAFYWKVATRADLGLADAYVDGDFSCAGDLGLLAFFEILIANRDRLRRPGQLPPKARGWWSPALITATVGSAFMYCRHLLRGNTLTNARRNIANHYDLSNELFELFLDETMTYSCAIFKHPSENLKDAQLRKLHALIDKAQIEPHHHVLEIGFGWGSMAIEVVRRTGCRYTGITLSARQLALAQQRVAAAGLRDKIRFQLCDYRLLPGLGAYDRILSCEMLEAVGHEYLGDFFLHCDRLLAMDGILVVQVITTPEVRYEEYRHSSDFIKEYIFPGCCVPAFAALTAAMAASSTFCVERVENIGPHYATTLLHWRDNFMARRSDVLRMGFGERFVCMWDYYFVYCAAGFRTCTLGDLQIVFTRPGNAGVFGSSAEILS